MDVWNRIYWLFYGASVRQCTRWHTHGLYTRKSACATLCCSDNISYFSIWYLILCFLRRRCLLFHCIICIISFRKQCYYAVRGNPTSHNCGIRMDMGREGIGLEKDWWNGMCWTWDAPFYTYKETGKGGEDRTRQT